MTVGFPVATANDDLTPWSEELLQLLGITSDRLEAEIAARHPIGLEPSGLKSRRQEQELEA